MYAFLLDLPLSRILQKSPTLEYYNRQHWRYCMMRSDASTLTVNTIVIIIIIIIIMIIIIIIIINFIAPHNNIRQFHLLKSSKFSLSQDYS